MGATGRVIAGARSLHKDFGGRGAASPGPACGGAKALWQEGLIHLRAGTAVYVVSVSCGCCSSFDDKQNSSGFWKFGAPKPGVRGAVLPPGALGEDLFLDAGSSWWLLALPGSWLRHLTNTQRGQRWNKESLAWPRCNLEAKVHE